MKRAIFSARFIALTLTALMLFGITVSAVDLSSITIDDIMNGSSKYDRFVNKISSDSTSIHINTEPMSTYIIVRLDADAALERTESVGEAEMLAQSMLNEQENVVAAVESAIGTEITVERHYTMVFNGFSFKGDASLVDIINASAVGYTAYIGELYSCPEPMATQAGGLIGADAVKSGDYAYTGKGMTVAIIDYGILYNHEAFSMEPDDAKIDLAYIEQRLPNLKASKNGYTASDLYYSAKIPFAYDYVDNAVITSSYPYTFTIGDHGTHVAGIAAGNNGGSFTGIAPDAQILSMNVFGQGGAETSTIIAALEDCAVLGVDAINISLGITCGYSDYEGDSILAEVYGNLEDAGITLSVAAGNESSSVYMNSLGSKALTSSPDTGVIASPSTFPEALSVAACNNIGQSKSTLLLNGMSYTLTDTSTDADNMNICDRLIGEYEYVNCGIGSADEIADIELSGKIALVRRGELTFIDKLTNVYDAGAVAMIVYNNEPGTIAMQIDNFLIPAVSVSSDTGTALLDALDKNFAQKISFKKIDTTSQICGFSSRGTTSDLLIKPEITAPGGAIYSSVASGTSAYELYDGTSMASPCIAGSMLLVRQFVNETFPNLSIKAKANMVNTLLMNTADIIRDENGAPYIIRAQGAGLVNVFDAVNAKAYITTNSSDCKSDKPKLELGDNPSKIGVYMFNFDVTNFGDYPVVYKIKTTAFTEAAVYDEKLGIYVMDESVADFSNDISFTQLNGGRRSGNGCITVNPGETVDVTMRMTLGYSVKNYINSYFENGNYIEGFVELIPQNGDSEGVIPSSLSIPLLAFYGDWNAAPMMNEVHYTDTLNGKTSYDYSGISDLVGCSLPIYDDNNNLIDSMILPLGVNPYVKMPVGTYSDKRNAISPNNDMLFDCIDIMCTDMLRMPKYWRLSLLSYRRGYSILDEGDYDWKSFFYSSDNFEAFLKFGYHYGADIKFAAEKQRENDIMLLNLIADLGYNNYSVISNNNSIWSVQVTKDTTAPTLYRAYFNKRNDSFFFRVTDNQYVAAAVAYPAYVTDEDIIIDWDTVVDSKGFFSISRHDFNTGTLNFSQYSDSDYVLVVFGDYACNENYFLLDLNSGEIISIK